MPKTTNFVVRFTEWRPCHCRPGAQFAHWQAQCKMRVHEFSCGARRRADGRDAASRCDGSAGEGSGNGSWDLGFDVGGAHQRADEAVP